MADLESTLLPGQISLATAQVLRGESREGERQTARRSPSCPTLPARPTRLLEMPCGAHGLLVRLLTVVS
jgi:hypothetical protein